MPPLWAPGAHNPPAPCCPCPWTVLQTRESQLIPRNAQLPASPRPRPQKLDPQAQSGPLRRIGACPGPSPCESHRMPYEGSSRIPDGTSRVRSFCLPDLFSRFTGRDLVLSGSIPQFSLAINRRSVFLSDPRLIPKRVGTYLPESVPDP